MKERLLWLVGGLLFFLHLSAGAALAYDISGTIQNGTTDGTHRVYVAVMQSGQSNSTGFGTSIASIPAGGTAGFTIRGVPNGTYQVAAFIDLSNTGSLHLYDPYVSSGSFAINNANGNIGQINLPAITAAPPAPPAPDPNRLNIVTTSNGALVQWHGATSQIGGTGPDAEMADSYVISWGTSPNPGNGSTATGSKTVPAIGEYHVFIGGLTDPSLYFAVKAVNRGGSNFTSTGPFSIVAGAGNATVTGRVYSAGITKSASTPLYIVLQGSNHGYIAEVPAPTDIQTWTIAGVQPDTYSVFVILDLNNDGFSKVAGYATGRGVNDGNNVGPSFTVPSGATAATAPDVTVTEPNSSTMVTTGNQNNFSYQLQFKVTPMLKRPVNVTVNSGPNLSGPMDLGLSLGNGGGNASRYGDNGSQVSISARPAVGDTYSVTVTYDDVVTPTETLSPKVTGVVTSLPSLIFPAGSTTAISSGSSLFAWTTPSSLPAGYYDYDVYLETGSPNYNQIWSPQDNGNGNMPSSQLSILFNSDNSASQSSLTSGSYNWSISMNDGFGNQGQSQGTFTPQPGGPTISDFLPLTGAAGASVTINGSGFSGASAVAFGGVNAAIISNTGTQITATVPSNAPVGPITVTAGGVTGVSTASFQATTTFTGSLKNSGGSAITGATVTLVDSNPVVSTITDGTGSFTITIPSGIPVSLKASASGYRDIYTSSMLYTAPYAVPSAHTMLTDANLTSLGFSVASKGLIASSVKDWDTDVKISGATVTATSFLHPATPYTVSYTSGTATGSDGKFYVPNVDEGDIVTVTATLAGNAAEPRTYVTHTGAISQTRVVVTPLQVVTAAPAGGTISSTQPITLSLSNTAAGDNYAIYYTTDNSDPTISNTVQTYTGQFFLNIGSVTLKFYAVNTTHNISGSVVTASYNVSSPQYPLNVSVTGFGQVTGIAASQTVLNCSTGNTGTCSSLFDPGTQVQLTGLASGDAYFSSWSGCDSPSGNGCTVTLNSLKNVSAIFAATVRLNSTDKPTIQQAFADAASGNLVQTQAYDYYENSLSLTTPVALTLKGGYDAMYTSNPGYSILHGILTIVNGGLTIERLIVQ